MKTLNTIFILLSFSISYSQSIPSLERIWSAFKSIDQGSIGSGVYGIGDINNDGYDDVAVGINDYGKFGTAIYYGGDPMDAVIDIWLPGGLIRAYGDINGDGLKDFFLYHDTPQSHRDSVYIHFGNVNQDTTVDMVIPPDTTIVRNTGFAQFHYAVHGDLNHDNYNDLVITDPYSDIDSLYDNKGKVYIYWGGPEFDNQVDITITGISHSAQLGWDVDTGDLNADGWDDLVIKGFRTFGMEEYWFDYIDIYMGNSEQNFTQKDFSIEKSHSTPWDNFGFYLAVFDYNADGYDDIITGMGYIFLGNAEFDTLLDHLIDNTIREDEQNVPANGGDLNGDSYNDLVLGLPDYNQNGGFALLYLGGPKANFSNIQNANIIPLVQSSFGARIDAAGDVNNDGINDVIVAEPGSGGTAVNIFSGDTTIVTSLGKNPVQYFPQSLDLKAYPNPFNNSVKLQFNVFKNTRAKIIVTDILGRVVTTLIDKQLLSGVHQANWQPDPSLPSGIFFARINEGNKSQTIKLLLLK